MSDDPPRLLDDPEVTGAFRDDLAALRDAAVDYDASAGLERLQGTLGAGAAGPGAAGAASAGGAKAWVIATVVVAVGGSIALFGASRDPARAPSSAATVAPAPSGISAPSVARPVDSSGAVRVEDLPVAPSDSAGAAPGLAPTTTATASTASSAPSAEERLRAELKQLAEVRKATGSNPGQALALANAGHHQFQGGVFYQEREALAISALLRLGRAGEAKTRARSFLIAFPRGPYAERVRKEAGLPGPTSSP